MNSTSILHILEYPNDNGIVVFVLGTIFILSIYHFLLYFQHKDQVYLYYSLYTFLLFAAHLRHPNNGFIPDLIDGSINNFLKKAWFSLIWANVLVYYIFAFTFVDLKAYSIKWCHFIFRSVYFLLGLSILLNILVEIPQYLLSLNNFYIYFVIATSILAITGYIPLFKMKHRLKYYIIIGSFFLFSSSIAATIIISFSKTEIGHSVFYIGIIIENIFFTLGLGAKQKLILQDKNDSQGELIKQLKENEKLRHTIQEQLESDVALLSEQAESDKLEKLKAKYDKELIELKMTSLRNQMNPHFIFNSLNSIKLYIINNEKENAVYYLNKFSKLIRKILASTQEKEITLADEIETIELYLNIENIRFNNEIEYLVTVDKKLNVNTIKLPCLILQPFVENAIWHGLASKKGVKTLNIKVLNDNQTYMKIEILDNGIGQKKSEQLNKKKIYKKRSFGIKITKERLDNFYKDYKNDYSLEIIDLLDESNLASGTMVSLKLPLN